MTHQIPKAVKRSTAWADAQIKSNARQLALHPRPGRPRTKKKTKDHTSSSIFADTLDEAQRQQTVIDAVLGTRSKGNKRLGQVQLYVTLIDCFFELERRGIRLPRGGSLSLRAFQNGLADILLKHGKITEEEAQLGLEQHEIRVRIGRRLKARFGRISSEIQKSTP